MLDTEVDGEDQGFNLQNDIELSFKIQLIVLALDVTILGTDIDFTCCFISKSEV